MTKKLIEAIHQFFTRHYQFTKSLAVRAQLLVQLDNNQDKLFQFEDSIAREDINEADTSKDETQSKIILSEKEIQTVIATTCASTQTEEVETVKDSPKVKSMFFINNSQQLFNILIYELPNKD